MDRQDYSAAHLEQFLRDRYRLVDPNELAIHEPIDHIEAQDFLAGMAAGLFGLNDEGYVQSPMIAPVRKGEAFQRTAILFGHNNSGPRTLSREYICQLGAVSALHFDYGWPTEQITMEPHQHLKGPVRNGADIVVRAFGDNDAPTVICGEVKSNSAGLKTMLAQLQSCGSLGWHHRDDCGFSPTIHRKFEACWRLRPAFFWAVCPGERRAFLVTFHQDKLKLIPVGDVPTYTG